MPQYQHTRKWHKNQNSCTTALAHFDSECTHFPIWSHLLLSWRMINGSSCCWDITAKTTRRITTGQTENKRALTREVVRTAVSPKSKVQLEKISLLKCNMHATLASAITSKYTGSYWPHSATWHFPISTLRLVTHNTQNPDGSTAPEMGGEKQLSNRLPANHKAQENESSSDYPVQLKTCQLQILEENLPDADMIRNGLSKSTR